MRKITKEVISAFLSCKPFRKGNDEVRMFIHYSGLYLHGNQIAIKQIKRITISDCGWQTSTTKERLNGLLSELGHKKIYQNDFSWFLEFQGTIHRIESNTQYIVVNAEGNLCFEKRF